MEWLWATPTTVWLDWTGPKTKIRGHGEIAKAYVPYFQGRVAE